ncbi:MAG: hypothetical protein KF800_00245 [Lysobacter sp.]|nr:hypothetical protein [Xanthomonadaceae bacterium]MBX3710381.1 hypothetical protein [Lysobacter sp.]
MSHEDRIRQRQIERLRQRAGKASDATAPPDDRVFSNDAREKLTAAGQGVSQVGKGLLALGQKASHAALEKAREAKAVLDAKRTAKAAETPPLAPSELAAGARPAAQPWFPRVSQTADESEMRVGPSAGVLVYDGMGTLVSAGGDLPNIAVGPYGTAPLSDLSAEDVSMALCAKTDPEPSNDVSVGKQGCESEAFASKDAIGMPPGTASSALEGAAPVPVIKCVPQNAPAPPVVVEAPRSTRSTPSNRPEHAPLRKAPLIAGVVLALASAAGIAWWATRDVSASDEPERPTPVQAETSQLAPPAVVPEMSPVVEPVVEPESEAAPVGRGEPTPSTLGIEPATAAPAPEPKAEPTAVAKPAAPKPVRQATPKPTPAPAPGPAAPTWQDEADAAMDAWIKQR